MPEFTSYPVGSPCWVDLMSPDVHAAEKFYAGLFGWTATPKHDADGNQIYTEFSLAEKAVCGMGEMPPEMQGAPAVWNTYVAVEDADNAVAKAEAAGGSVIAPVVQVEQAGRMAVLADPTGAVFSVWEAGEHFGAQVANETNTWSWNELLTRDVETGKAFYAELFGWNFLTMEMATGAYHLIEPEKNGGYGGVMAMVPQIPEEVPNHWMVYFFVDDVDEACRVVADLGGTVAAEPFDVPGVGTIAVVCDPHGGVFSVMKPVPPV